VLRPYSNIPQLQNLGSTGEGTRLLTTNWTQWGSFNNNYSGSTNIYFEVHAFISRQRAGTLNALATRSRQKATSHAHDIQAMSHCSLCSLAGLCCEAFNSGTNCKIVSVHLGTQCVYNLQCLCVLQLYAVLYSCSTEFRYVLQYNFTHIVCRFIDFCHACIWMIPAPNYMYKSPRRDLAPRFVVRFMIRSCSSES
jgi:hypothetical protein